MLRKARQHRSLFHLWHNILPAIRTYAAEAGEEKPKEFTAELKNVILSESEEKVWNAANLAAAREELEFTLTVSPVKCARSERRSIVTPAMSPGGWRDEPPETDLVRDCRSVSQ